MLLSSIFRTVLVSLFCIGLSACAGGHSSGSASHSKVEVYGDIDTGIATETIRR